MSEVGADYKLEKCNKKSMLSFAKAFTKFTCSGEGSELLPQTMLTTCSPKIMNFNILFPVLIEKFEISHNIK